MSDWNWIRSWNASDLNGGYLIDKALEVTSSGSGEITISVPFSGSGNIVWYSPIGQPESTEWRAGEFAVVKIRVVTPNTNIIIQNVSIQRIRQSGTLIATYANTAANTALSVGVKTFTMTTLAQSGVRPSDRVRVFVVLTHNGFLGSTSVGIGYGDPADGLITTAITKMVKRYRAASISDADEISAIPTSLAPLASAASLGMSATVVAVNPPRASSTSGGPSAEPS